MEYKKEDWESYSDRLKTYKYTDDEILAVKIVREGAEQIPNDMFDELVKQGVIERTRKLKKKRTLYILENDNRIYYLEHHFHNYQWCGKFKEGDK